MTVKELIEELSKYDENLEVCRKGGYNITDIIYEFGYITLD